MSHNSKTNTVLVVDDVPVNIQLLSTYLSAEGYYVISARNGLEALDQIQKNSPDLVLLDVMMPKMNGFEVCEIVKADKETKFIPVIMVTALNELQDKIKGMNSGADDFICKPFNKLELLVRVRSLLRIKSLNDVTCGINCQKACGNHPIYIDCSALQGQLPAIGRSNRAKYTDLVVADQRQTISRRPGKIHRHIKKKILCASVGRVSCRDR